MIKPGSFLKFFAFLLIITVVTNSSCTVIRNIKVRNAEKGMSGHTRSVGREPRVVRAARKKQEANNKKMKKATANASVATRKHSLDIQTPDVKSRMKQEQKDLSARDKKKHKKIKSLSREAGQKYN